MANTTKTPKGKVTINQELCKGCGFCVAFCPKNMLELAQEYNSRGYHYPVAYHEEECIGCDKCGEYCPDFAIHGTKIKNQSIL